MAQLSLFDNGPQRLLDDASGRIVLVPDLVDDALLDFSSRVDSPDGFGKSA